MTRATQSVVRRERHRKILKLAKGYRGRNKNVYRIALERVEKGLSYAYRDRRARKREFRRLWITRINAGARLHGLTYAQFMHRLTQANITLNRKTLADLAYSEPEVFRKLTQIVS